MSHPITPRQHEIKAMLNNGQSPKEVAAALGVTATAIYSHIRRMEDRGIQLPEGVGRRRRNPNATTKRGSVDVKTLGEDMRRRVTDQRKALAVALTANGAERERLLAQGVMLDEYQALLTKTQVWEEE